MGADGRVAKQSSEAFTGGVLEKRVFLKIAALK